MNPKITVIIAGELQIPVVKTQNTIDLIADGATIPFIARYRKENDRKPLMRYRSPGLLNYGRNS